MLYVLTLSLGYETINTFIGAFSSEEMAREAAEEFYTRHEFADLKENTLGEWIDGSCKCGYDGELTITKCRVDQIVDLWA